MILKLLHFALSVAAILVSAYLIPGVETTLLGAAIFAFVLGIINLTIKPVLTILTLPITILTLGLFSALLNIGIIVAVAYLIPGLFFTNIWTAVFFAMVLSIINHIFHFGLPQ